MSRAWAAGLVGLLLNGCAAGLPQQGLWDDVEAMERAPERRAAQGRIRARGPEGLDALVMAARCLGEQRALSLLNDVELGIFGFPLHQGVEPEQIETPAGQAVLAAYRWLQAQPELALHLARSDDWFGRSLAVMSQLKNPAGLWAVLDAVGQVQNPQLTMVSVSVLHQASQHAGDSWQAKLAQRSADLEVAETWSDERCRQDSAGFAGLVEQVRTGAYKKGSHSSRNNALRVHLDRPDGREVAVGPGCALEIYHRLAAKDQHLPELIMPLLNWGVVDVGLRRQAAEHVLADLERIPEDKRNLALARVINAGGQTDQRVQPVSKVLGFDVAEILEAMARQDPEAARSHLKRFWLCSEVFGNAKLIALSGLAPSPQAAHEAYEIGQQCEHGLEPALIALLHMGDQRATELLDKRLEKDFPPISTEVIYALREHRSEALSQHLTSRASAGNLQAKHILANW